MTHSVASPGFSRGDDDDSYDPFAGPAIAASIPSTDPQREVWTATRMGEDASLAFNEAVSISLRGALDQDALRSAVRDLVCRHESLRATFSDDGLTMLVLEEPGDVPVVLHDWTGLDAAEQAARMRSLETRAVESPFDLMQGRLVRFELVRLADREHTLVVTAHHIICDGWSYGIIASDLAALYTARRAGTHATLPRADRFSDYARAALSSEARAGVADAESYWVRQFADRIPVLDLPTDRTRPPLRTYRAGREDRVLAADVMRHVSRAGGRQGASLFATLFAGFAALLHRLSGQDDIVVGIPTAGQAAASRERLVGHLVRMLPIRAHVAGDQSVSELLKQSRTAVLDATEHQELTFGSLLQRLPSTRDPSRPPLVSVVFNLDRGVGSEQMPFAGLDAALRSIPRSYENFDLFLNAVDLQGAVTLECQYNAALFDRETVREWLATYELLLAAMADQADRTVAALPIVTDAERERLARGPELPSARAAAMTVHRLVEDQVRRTPDAVAIECDGQVISYRQLNARANQVARQLRAIGVHEGLLVGVCLERSIDLVVGILAVLKAGGGYVPLDPAYPLERLAFMVSDSGMSVVITDQVVQATTPVAARDVVSLDGHAAAIAAQADANLDATSADASADSPAYVIYTSGSTGKPKGVLVSHGSVVNLLLSVQETPGMDSRDVVLAITTLSFDIAVSELLLPLTVGARIVMATRDTAADGAQLRRLVEGSGVTFIDATPATYRLLLGAGWSGAPGLRLICTGEAMPRDLAESLCGCAPEVWNGYGPTETTVWSSFWRVRAPVTRVLIGRPVANTRMYVLDALMQPVPVGVKGELYIAGAGVSIGYLNRPELTRERFVANPFSAAPSARMYRTGDVVRFLADGNIEYMGRNDHQVKVRGYRIELGEIEDALATHSAVAQAAVLAREHRPGDVRLVAYVVAGDGATDAELRAHVKRTLPEYMVPQVVVRLAAMPLTPSGKVDRKALPTPERGEAVREAEFIEPRTGTERMLADVWADALGLTRVSVRDDFFALGGHSLLAGQILARIRREYGVELSFRTVFQAPTIEQFADLVDRNRNGAPTRRAVIQARPGATSAPLSVVQERLWSLEELDPSHRPAHNHASCFRLRGALDVSALSRALAAFARRHDAMRASFHVLDGVRTQVVAPEVEWPLKQLDFSPLTAAERDAKVEELARSEQAAPMDLATAPLARINLVRLASDEHLLLIVAHGMIWDGWSFDIFIRDVAQLYRAAIGAAPDLPALPVSYGDFAAWQQDWLRGLDMARQVAWWREQLDGPPPALELPYDRPRPAVSALSGGSAHVMLTSEEREALQAFASANDTTLFVVLLAAYVVLLHRATGQCDIVVGSPMRARSWVETEGVIGPFVNTVAIRVRVHDGMSFADLLRSVRDVTLESIGHQEMPIELLGSKPPILRALFSMQDARTRPAQVDGLSVSGVPVPIPYAANDMMLWTMQTPRGLLAALNYSSELFDASTATRYLERYRHVLQSIRRDPSRSVATIDILPEAEVAIVMGQSQAAGDAADAPSVVAAVERAVSAAPDATAVVADGGAMSYRDLAARAVRIASALTKVAGPVSAKPVAVLIASRLELPGAVLGVLRTGANVLIADTASPAPYLEALLAPTAIAAIVADQAALASIPSASSSVPTVTIDSLAAATGLPDCGDQSDAGMATVLAAVRRRLDVQPADVVVLSLPQGADSTALAMLLPLTSGARLVLADDSAPDGEALAAAIQETDATIAVASLDRWLALAATSWRAKSDFRAAVVGPLVSANHLETLRERVDRVVALYGHPEAGTWSVTSEIAPKQVDHAPSSETVGVALEPEVAVVLDAGRQPAAIGVPGDLYLGGSAVGHAIERNGIAIRSRVVRVSHAGREMVLVSSGDRARRLENGTFEPCGSDGTWGWVDGLRVPLAAIDRALAQHPGVAEAAAQVHRDAAGIARVVGYVVLRSDSDCTPTALRSTVRSALPQQMVPQRIIELDALPRDKSGAVDRAALASPYQMPHAASQFVGPRTPGERLLADAWRNMLGVERVSVTDNFFMLGGFSLLCFRLIERVQRDTGVRLSPRLLLLGTLEQAAAQLSGGGPE